MKELFRNVVGFPLYKVSNMGRIYSIKNKRILKLQEVNGYNTISLSRNHNVVTRKVARLVAEAFLDEENLVVNHLDGNKKNDNVNNLEWTTYSGNLKHAHDRGLMPKIHKKNKKNTSGQVGVVWDKCKGRWIARLHKNGKAIYLGMFINKTDAIKCRKDAERKCLTT